MKRGTVFHLVHFQHPEKTIKRTTDLISFYIHNGGINVDKTHKGEGEGLYKLCTLDFDPTKGEKAVILKISLVYTHNETQTPFIWDTEPIFEKDNTSETDQSSQSSHHPDTTGTISLVIPGDAFSGPLPNDARLIYEPKMVHLGISLLPYIGLEHHILNARSTCVSQAGLVYEYQAFKGTDPLVVFLLENKSHFDEVNAQDIKKLDENVYIIKRPLVKRIQTFFANTVFSLIKYVSNPTLTFRWRTQPPPLEQDAFVNAMIQIDYVVTSPSVYKYKLHDLQITI